MNTLVDFETAKLLKRKGFNEPVIKAYSSYKEEGMISSVYNSAIPELINSNTYEITPNVYPYPPYYSAPTIAEVVMWLYEKYGIWITPLPISKNKWYWEILHSYEEKKGWTLRNDSNEFNSPREASFKAINYTLNILIPKTK